MALYVKTAGRDQELKWAWIWFKQLSEFHGIQGKGNQGKGAHGKGAHQEAEDGKSHSGNSNWEFSMDQVILFLQSKRDSNVPAWKRMKIIEGLITFRIEVQGRSAEDLVPLQTKMVEIIAIERAKNGGFDSIEDVVGVINPNETDAIQAFRRALRKDGKALATERSYVGKLKKFMAERAITCLADFESIGADEVETHLTDLAVDGNVAPKTQNAAFHALLSFFKLVLKRDMGRIEAIRATKGEMVPTVLSAEEVIRVFAGLSGVHLVVAKLLYGCGMRISEAMRLRVKDIDFANRQIEIRDSKGGKSRLVPMPENLVEPLERWVASREVLHRHDLAEGTASAWLPHALSRKYPTAHQELRWQFLFASDRLSRDPRTGQLHRHHLHKDTFPNRLRHAVDAAELNKRVTSHTFRHCFATHHLWQGTDIRTIQHLLGHSDVATTEIYTHVRNPKESKVISPLDRLQVVA